MAFSLNVRFLRNLQGEDGHSRKPRLDDATAADGDLPIVAAASSPRAVEDVDPLLPRQAEANAPEFRPTTFAPSGTIITLTHAIPAPETTLQTSVRPKTPLGPSTVSRSPLPVTTGRPSLGPLGPQSLSLVPSSSQTSLVPVASGTPTIAPNLVPVASASATTGTSSDAMSDQATAQPSVTAAPSSSNNAGSIVGYTMLVLVGLATLVGGYFFIRKCVRKRNDRLRSPSPSDLFSGRPSTDEAPMVMARTYPDIAAQLGAIAARAEQGELGSTVHLGMTHSQNGSDRRGFPFAENGPANSPPTDEALMVMARSYPNIAAKLEEIAARAERGELGPTILQPRPSQDGGEAKASPFADGGPLPDAPERPLQETYLVPPEHGSEVVDISPGIGPSAPRRGPPMSFYSERSSGYVNLESPVVPDIPNATRQYVR